MQRRRCEGKLLTAKPTSDDWAKQGFSYVFDSSAHLQSISDPLGRTVDFDWTGSPTHLTTITTWDDRFWTLGYSSGRLATVAAPELENTDRETVAFGYNGSGALNAVTDGRAYDEDPSEKTTLSWGGGLLDRWGSGCGG